MINLRSKEEIERIRQAAVIAARVLAHLKENAKAGISTSELERQAESMISGCGARPAFKNYRGYPASICVSINEQVVHGIPGQRALKSGDVLSIDVGIEHEGYFADAALTLPVGAVRGPARRLIDVTRESLYAGIEQARGGRRLYDISSAIQNYVEKNGFSVVRSFVGHGIGTSMHEDPALPNYGKAGCGPLLKAGMVLAIEPMVNMGGADVKILEDGWTAVTVDGLPSAHFEHTVAITHNGPEILSKYE